MKKFALVLSLSLGLLTQRSHANTTPGAVLEPLKTSVSNELVAATNTAEPDKKLVSALNKSITFLDRATDSDLAADLKLFSQVSASLGKVDGSDNLDASVSNVFEAYLEFVWTATVGSSNRLQNAFASKTRTSAEKNIALVFRYLTDANGLQDMVAAAKLLSKAGTKWAVADALVERALDAPAPKAGFTAQVTGAVSTTVKPDAVVANELSAGNVYIIATDVLLKAPYGQRVVTLTMLNLVAGNNTLTIGIGGVDAGFANNIAGGDAYGADSGTITVNYNPASHSVSGTFSFTGAGGNAPGTSVTVTGSFSGAYGTP